MPEGDERSDSRGAAVLGEDNELIYGELLGLGSSEIEQLKSDGVI